MCNINTYDMAVRFYLDNRPDKNGDHPIRAGISMKGKRFLTSIGFSISPDKWDGKRVKRGCSNSKGITYTVINLRLGKIETLFLTVENKLLAGEITDVDIKRIYRENFGEKDQQEAKEEAKSFFDYMDEFTQEMGKENGWTIAVHEKFAALKNHLMQFKRDLTFDYFTKDGLNNFVGYLHTVPVAGKVYKDKDTRVFGMRNSTIKKQLGFLKWFLRWATRSGYNTETSFEAFTPKLKNTTENKIVFLDWDELMTVYNYPIPEQKKYLDRVRDVFCFCCFTSLRYSDVANLRRSDVFDDHISITTVKTADTLTIDLNDYSKAILKKYENETYPGNKALPVISNQRMNEYLKELGELCGIDTPVTITYYKGNQRYDEVYPKYELLATHTGRRTFISNALMMGIPPQIVMKWTGHSDYKAMKPYIEIADKAKAEAMTLFNKK